MHCRGKKTLLFIEPCLSSYFLVIKAKEKGYTTLVLSSHSGQRLLPEEVLNASSSFFQLDTSNEEAVLYLVEKIAQKFYINGVIPGTEYYMPLTAKVAKYLNKPGLTPESALRIQRKDLIRDTLKAHGFLLPKYRRVETKEELKTALQQIKFPCMIKSIVCPGSIKVKKAHTFKEAFDAFKKIMDHKSIDSTQGNLSFQKGALVEEYIEGKEYSIEGFLKNHTVHIISMTEKFFSFESSGLMKKGQIVASEIDSELFTMIAPYLKKVTSVLDLNDGPFQAQVKLSEKGPFLIEIAMRFADSYIPKLIEYATSIDYYDNALKLFSGQPLSLHKTQRLNAGISFFYASSIAKICTKAYFDTLMKHPYTKETKVCNKPEERVLKGSQGNRKLGYAIFLHKDYRVLKRHMEDQFPMLPGEN